jgi:hypothetical protein
MQAKLPDFVFTIFSTGDNQVVASIPVTSQHDTIMGSPLNLFLSGLQWLQMDQFIRAIENLIGVRAPA